MTEEPVEDNLKENNNVSLEIEIIKFDLQIRTAHYRFLDHRTTGI